MAYVIAEPCIGTKDAACVDACPVDCIHPKKDEGGFAESDQLFIDPVECIDCGACVPVCPVSAIYAGGRLAGEVGGLPGEERDAFRPLKQVRGARFEVQGRARGCGCAFCIWGVDGSGRLKQVLRLRACERAPLRSG